MNLLIEREARVLTLVLNRVDKRNALTLDMCSSMAQAISSAQHNREIGSILIRAQGQVFCAGMDLDEAASLSCTTLDTVHEKLFTIGAHSLKPIVVHVNGPALGGGLGLVAQGHVVIAAQGALFGLPEIRVGLWPFVIYRSVEAALGPRRTQELSLTGRVFSTTEAMQWGLVHQVTLPFESEDRAAAVARELSKSSPQAISHGMQYIRASRGKTSTEAAQLASALRRKLMHSADFKEGYSAFKEKRNPKWPSMQPGFHREHHTKAGVSNPVPIEQTKTGK